MQQPVRLLCNLRVDLIIFDCCQLYTIQAKPLGNPEVWFRQIESVFMTRKPAITTQQTKFDYVIQALDNNGNSNKGIYSY